MSWFQSRFAPSFRAREFRAALLVTQHFLAEPTVDRFLARE
jgi:hypothetical protein